MLTKTEENEKSARCVQLEKDATATLHDILVGCAQRAAAAGETGGDMVVSLTFADSAGNFVVVTNGKLDEIVLGLLEAEAQQRAAATPADQEKGTGGG